VALAALAVAYGAALAAASSVAGKEWLRSRAETALRARLGEVSIGDRTAVDGLFRVSLGPIERPAAGAIPLVRIERARVRPSLSALLSGRVEPASVLLQGVRVEGLAVAGRTTAVGPFDVVLRTAREGEGRRLRADVAFARGGSATLDATRGSGGWRARIRASAIGIGAPASTVSGGELSFDVEAEASADLSRAGAHVRAAIDGLVLTGERISERPLGPLRATAAGTIEWDRLDRRIALRDGSATLPGNIDLAVSGDVRLVPGTPFSAVVRANGVDHASLVAALPDGLAPPPSAPRPAGTFDARLDVAGPARSPAEWSVSASIDLSRMRALARRGPQSPLATPFSHHPFGAEPSVPPILVGPGNPDFVPIAELPEHVVRAVTTAEDAGFFAHAGFDFEELRNAFAQGAEAGHLVRGGSTISQQLAKNLFLGPERTLARKVREAVVAIGLEASVPKRRLLEIYLNVAEWGPGVWGIGPAARVWLGKDARALTPKEAAFLASVIPSPVRYHSLLADGAASAAFEERVRRILLGMTQNGALTDDQLLDALDQPLRPAGG